MILDPVAGPLTSTDALSIDEMVEIVDRLAAESDALPLGDLMELVVACRRDLSGVPRTALPELVERLARQRLIAQAQQGG
jgi:hypothetical protein